MLVFALSVRYAASQPVSHEKVSIRGESSQAGDVIGMAVKNPQGDPLGIITDVVAGPQGRRAFAVIDYWVSDDTQKRVAVPFGTLSCNEQNCVLPVGKNTLASAPPFVIEDDLAQPKLAEHIYRYFGLQPYWTEEGIQR